MTIPYARRCQGRGAGGLMVGLFIAACAVLLPAAAVAHELRPAIADIAIGDDGVARIEVATNLEALIAGIGPEHSNTADAPNSAAYDRFRLMEAAELRREFARLRDSFLAGVQVRADGEALPLRLVGVETPPVGEVALPRISRVRMTAELPASTQALIWDYPETYGDSIVRVRKTGDAEPFFSAYVQAGDQSEAVQIDQVGRQPAWSVFVNYLVVGFEHILPKGLDHILFMIGLFLLSPRLRPLAWQVTGFTIAHSITLALGMYGVLRISPAVVEPIIAASIIFIAVENLFTDRLRRWRPFVVFGFGLLHGLGFAGVLSDFGLPRDQFLVGLFAFNVGVEVAQLTVIGLCFLAVGLSFGNRSWYRPAIAMPLSAVIAIIAGFWFVERVGGFA